MIFYQIFLQLGDDRFQSFFVFRIFFNFLFQVVNDIGNVLVITF